MIYIVYLILVPISLVLTLIALITAPIMPIFAKQVDGWLDNHSIWGIGPRLPTWLNWFMTPDNSLDGDATFQEINGRSYWSKVKWLWRNPAYSFSLKYLNAPYTATVYGNKTIKDNDNAKAGWCFVRANGLFQFRYIKRIATTNRCILVNLGWNIMGLVDDNVQPKPTQWQATFVFSPRISGFR
jgi:hypothetical protein